MALAAAMMAAKAVQLAAAALLCGAPAFDLLLRHSRGLPDWQRPWLLAAALPGAAAAAGGLTLQAAILADGPVTFDLLHLVMTGTDVGRFALIRLALFLLLAILVARPMVRLLPIAGLGAILAASFAWAGHGAVTTGAGHLLHLGADIAHLLSASLWVGALIVLSAQSMRAHRSGRPADRQALHDGMMAFSGIGLAVVTVLVVSGLINGWYLVGIDSWSAVVSSPYGLSLGAKLALFAAMLALAAANRFWLTARLATADDDGAVRAVRRSVLAETLLALLVLALVGVLGMLEPVAG